MSLNFEELDYQQTDLGELTLRRRRLVSLEGAEVFEIKLGDSFLMSSLFNKVEIALADLALAELGGDALEVVVGGLGLGYTARAALDNASVQSVIVVEALSPVIDWHRRGLVPLGASLATHPRCRFVQGDFFRLLDSPGLDPENPGKQFHAILLDIDHSPRNLLHPRHASFYESAGLRRVASHLKPAGVFAMWSDDPPDEQFLDALDLAFGNARAHIVTFPNPLADSDSASTVYVARKTDSVGASPARFQGVRTPIIIAILLLATAVDYVVGRVLPLTVKDVCLMLRSGYSSEAVQQELSTRHLAGVCDAAAEQTLIKAGATPALIEAMKSPAYQTSPADAEAALGQLAVQAQRQALEAERLRKMDSLYQTERARERAAARPVEIKSLVADQVKGDLVYWNNGSLARFDDAGLGSKKLIALYFSAYWCGPCRKFTPQLVEYYNRVKAQHPEFEIVFVSNDRSLSGMETYMRDMKMPWPAIAFEKLAGKEALKKYSGDGIPCLVLLDASGKVLSHTYADKKFLGPEKVLADLDALFAGGPVPQVAQAR